jgi:PAS domain S-box-containing protein
MFSRGYKVLSPINMQDSIWDFLHWLIDAIKQHWQIIAGTFISLWALIKFLRRNRVKGQGFYKLLKEFISINARLVNLDKKFDEKFGEILEQNKYLQNQINVQYEASNIAMWRANGKGQCIFVNEAYCRLFDKEKYELLGNGWLSTIAQNNEERTMRLWNAAIEGRTQSYIEFEANTCFGVKRVKASFTVYEGKNGFVEFQGTTQLVRSEEIKEN